MKKLLLLFPTDPAPVPRGPPPGRSLLLPRLPERGARAPARTRRRAGRREGRAPARAGRPAPAALRAAQAEEREGKENSGAAAAGRGRPDAQVRTGGPPRREICI